MKIEKYDATFVGNGVTAPSMFYEYYKNGNGKYLLLVEPDENRAAITKGVKTANLIVPKQPKLHNRFSAVYQETTALVRSSEIKLKEFLGYSHAYIGKSNTGIRIGSEDEMEILRKLGISKTTDKETVDAGLAFAKRYLGTGINKDCVFPYNEHTWDAQAYLKKYAELTNVPDRKSVKEVKFYSSEKDVLIEVVHFDGTTELVATEKLFVCKGVGNIEFENTIIFQLKRQGDQYHDHGISLNMDFNIVTYYKSFYPSAEIYPLKLSSIIIPETGICFTNEQNNNYSLLYDTNSHLKPADSFDVNKLTEKMPLTRDQLQQSYPSLNAFPIKEHMCTMTLHPKATGDGYKRHFNFIHSQSVCRNIHYVNLPYFTVIRTALEALPKNTNDFIWKRK